MKTSHIQSVLEEMNILILEKLEFKTKQQELLFLSKVKEFTKQNVQLHFLNNDLLKILNEMTMNEEHISKLKKINWEDFIEIFSKKEKTRQEERIYRNFLDFLKIEFSLPIERTTLDENLLNTKRSESKLDSKLFVKKEHFNVKEDLREKAEKFKVEILFDYTEDPKKITVQDFILYFNRRLQYFQGLLSGRVSIENLMSIAKLKDLYETNTQVSIIGLVLGIDQTKNEHIMLTLEDKTGQIKCFIHKDKLDLIKQVQNLCLDEGIAIVGKVGKEIIWVDEIIIPSPPHSAELKTLEKEEYVIFLSDIHFGAKVFVDEAFQKLIDWLNSRTSNEELNEIAKKIKYIIVAGDIIEGIGVYPNQGKDARILSTELQYNEATRWFSQIPSDKCIIMIPGNHDTDRLSEPQPKLPYEKTYSLYNMSNVIMLSNPSIINLFSEDDNGPLKFCIYHGGSIFYYADKMQNLREKGGAKVPEEVIKFLLEKRHLAPSHGSTLYIPDSQRDPLVIEKMPDFFITGHTHKLSLANYKGCTIVSCGCWVEMSDYQEKMGMFPDIGKCTLINMKTRKPRIINFYTEKYKRKDQQKS